MRPPVGPDHADQFLPILLQLCPVRYTVEAERRRLLRLLQLWLHAVSADSGAANGWCDRFVLRERSARLTNEHPARTPRGKDWASNWRTLALFWGIPAGAMLASGLLEPAARGVIWTIALVCTGITLSCECPTLQPDPLRVHIAKRQQRGTELSISGGHLADPVDYQATKQ